MFVRHLNSSSTLQRQQQHGSQQQQNPQPEEEPKGATRDSLPAGNRRQRRAARSAQRAVAWRAAYRQPQQQPAGNQQPQQEQPPPAREAPQVAEAAVRSAPSTPPSARPCVVAPEATEVTPHGTTHGVQGGHAQRGPARSPGGGATTGPRLQPPSLSPQGCQGGPPQPPAQPVPALAHGRSPIAIAPTPIAPSSQLSSSFQSMLAHIREHEYPEYMNFHMMQGMTQENAHASWHGYERGRMERWARDMGHMT